jgi:hypothetical protein
VDGVHVEPNSPQPIRIHPGVDSLSLVAAQGSNGRISRNSFRAANLMVMDAAISRTFNVHETTPVEIRLEAFNLFNRTQLGVPVRILESPGFGRAFDTQVPARSLRVGIKVSF